MRHHLHGVHVDLIEIRPLLAIDFDVHEVLVHELRDLFVFKRLVRHHVTPVTRRITDAQQHRFVLAARFFKRFFTPRIPIDRIVSVLQKIRTGFVDQVVGELSLFHSNPLLNLVFEPVRRFLRPRAIWIFAMKNVESGLGPARGVFIRATVTRGFYCQVECFRHARIGRMAVGPLNDFARDVIRSGAECA